jgi:diguanylate cyclase (GGDEF)-like protein
MLIEWTVYATGDPASPYGLFYFWVAIYAFYFLPRGQAALQVVFIAAAYAGMVVLAETSDSDTLFRWAVTACALVVSGALIGLLKDHVDRLIGRLSDAARTDTLTGLLNRRGFYELIETELERARRSGSRLTVIVGDLDRFKAVNDGFGHRAGDRALERVGAALNESKRRIDAAARIGGEEFAVVAPDTGIDGAYVLAERLRRAVRDAFEDERFDLSISLGAAAFPEHGGSAEGLMHTADQALYAAKSQGRDRTVVYDPEVPTTLDPEHVAGEADEIARELGLDADTVARVAQALARSRAR